MHIKGAGWSETGNIYTLEWTIRTSATPAGSSQGDVTVRIHAPGETGWHFLDLYPAIYNGKIQGPGQPPPRPDVNGSYFLLPMLNVAITRANTCRHSISPCSSSNAVMLLDFRATDKLRGQNGPLTAVIDALLRTALEDASIDLGTLRMVCDWVQYKHNFREAAQVRPVVGGTRARRARDRRRSAARAGEGRRSLPG